MNKQVKHTYGGITKDITKSRFPNTNYFSAHNFRITADDNQSTYSLTNEKGTKVHFTFPSIIVSADTITTDSQSIPYINKEVPIGTYINNVLLGSIQTTDGIVFFTHGDIDAVWFFNIADDSLKLLYIRKLNFNIENQITGVSNFENDRIERIYWVDGINQLRHLNIRHSKDNGDYENIIDIPMSSLQMSGNITLNQPEIIGTSTGGQHTAGMIQYAYSLYRLNNAQSTISPLSSLTPLNNGSQGGGDVNEQVNTVPIVRIEDIDNNYTNIIVYAIKYTSYNQQPTVSIIYDQRIPDNRTVTIYDTGSLISLISLEEFVLSSKSVVFPKHVVSKDNRLFLSNYQENNLRVNLDVRAYSFSTPLPSTATSRVYSDIESLTNLVNTPTRIITTANIPDDPEDTFDNINLDFDTYKYSMGFFDNGTTMEATIGGTNKYLTYEIIPSNTYNNRHKYFKDNEIYRIAIEFYNSYGQTTLPMWISDFKAPEGNLRGRYNTLKFSFKPAFYDWLNSQSFNDYTKPVGYRILVADRTAQDKTIVASGIASTMVVNDLKFARIWRAGTSNVTVAEDESTTNKIDRIAKYPTYLMRNLNQEFIANNNRLAFESERSTPVQNVLQFGILDREINQTSEANSQYTQEGGAGAPTFRLHESRSQQYTKMLQLFSPETVFNQGLSMYGDISMIVRGLMKNTDNKVWGQELNVAGNVITQDAKGDSALSVAFVQNSTATQGAASNIHDRSIIDHPGGSTAEAWSRNLFYRKYGISTAPSANNGTYLSILSGVPYYNLVSETNNISNVDLITSTSFMRFNITATNAHALFSARLRLTVNNATVPYQYFIKINTNGSNTTYEASTSDGTSIIEIPDLPFNITNNGYVTLEVKLRSTNSVALNGILEIEGTVDGSDHILKISNSQDMLNSDDYSLVGDEIPYDLLSQLSPSTNVFQHVIDNNKYNILGSPEYAVRGQEFSDYNNNTKYKYVNTLNSFATYANAKEWEHMGAYGRRIVSINSDATGNITIVPRHNNGEITLESIYTRAITEGAKIDDCAPYIELVKSDTDIYLGGIYGGNSYEDKRRTKYNRIGKFTPLSQNTQYIASPGDTYVLNFKFLRICRSDDFVINEGTYHMEEIVEYPVETTIDLLNRNDHSLNQWDSKISYTFDEYHNYNQVYSQTDNLLQKTNNEYYVKDIDGYSTNVISSKLKSAGEVIDNWLSLQTNEVITLDGKFGPVTNLIYLNDEIYTMQDRAMCRLSINPRVQVQGGDGVAIELGSGAVLQDYQYITTAMGCRNKFSSFATPYGIYFYDSINKRINMFNGQLVPLSETAGLHSFLTPKDLTLIDNDTPLLGSGNAFGYDHLNNDVYLTFNTPDEIFTLKYTEKDNVFVTDDVYGARHYIGSGAHTLASLGDNKIHRLGVGSYNNYYGVNRPSKITMLINPEADVSIVVNNIAFKSEVYIQGKDQPDRTLTHIRVYNEYQDSGTVPLVNNRRGNIQRLFREWNAQIPRVNGSRERIRNPWTFLELTYNNPDGSEIILHDMIVSYSM